MTVELLESEDDDSSLLAELANSLAQADVPSDIVRALRLGRITALQKPDNGVRGIVVGEFIRRLVARTLAKQFSEQAKEATVTHWKPAQGACVAHVIQRISTTTPQLCLWMRWGLSTSFHRIRCSQV